MMSWQAQASSMATILPMCVLISKKKRWHKRESQPSLSAHASRRTVLGRMEYAYPISVRICDCGNRKTEI